MRNVIHIDSPTNWDSNYRELEYVKTGNLSTGGNNIETNMQMTRGRYYEIVATAGAGYTHDGHYDGPSGWFFKTTVSMGGGGDEYTGVKVGYDDAYHYDTGTHCVFAGIRAEDNYELEIVSDNFLTLFPNYNTKRVVWLKIPSSGSGSAGVNDVNGTVLASVDGISYRGDPAGEYNSKIVIGGVTNYPVGQLIYRFRVYSGDSNGTVLAELVPAQNKYTGVCGLYNLQASTFYPLNTITSETWNPAGPTANENPLWSPGVSYRKSVVKIEKYVNGNLIQLWPCYSPGPSNPDAPVVSNAFDYDDNITWTVGTGVENTDEYYYYPITATGQANGIQIAVADNPNGWNDDGKPTSSTTYTWYVQAERAGYYQMVMSAKMSSAGHATTGYWSGANIQVNGSTSGVQKLELYGDTPDFDAVDYNDVVVAIVPLTGYEDAVSFQQSSWRIVVDPTSNIIFREIAATSPAFLTLDTTNVTTSYTQGDTFSYSGLVVYQTLVNGTANTISSGYTVSSPDMSTTGTKTVTVTYGGLTASYDITVASAGATWVTTATLTNSDNKTVEQGTCGGYDAVRIGVLDYSTGGFGSDGRVSSTSTDEVYKITPPSAGDYMLILPIRRGSGDPQFYINGNSIGAVYGTSSSEFLYIEITYPITLTSGENTLTIRNNSYRCYWDTDNYVYLVKSSTNPFS